MTCECQCVKKTLVAQKIISSLRVAIHVHGNMHLIKCRKKYLQLTSSNISKILVLNLSLLKYSEQNTLKRISPGNKMASPEFPPFHGRSARLCLDIHVHFVCDYIYSIYSENPNMDRKRWAGH